MKQKFHFIFAVLIFFVGCKNAKPVESLEESPAEVITNIDVDQARTLINDRKDLIIIDVRTPDEWKEGTLPGTINIDVEADDFRERVDSLDKEATYLVHCRSGRRSVNAVETMKELGFKHIYHMLGGYLAWQEKEEE